MKYFSTYRQGKVSRDSSVPVKIKLLSQVPPSRWTTASTRRDHTPVVTISAFCCQVSFVLFFNSTDTVRRRSEAVEVQVYPSCKKCVEKMN